LSKGLPVLLTKDKFSLFFTQNEKRKTQNDKKTKVEKLISKQGSRYA